MKYKLDFRTSYNQFYIYDKGSPANTDSPSFWTAEAYDERLAIDDGILGVGTASYGHIRGELDILNSENRIIDYHQYGHVVEGGLEVKSGILQILDCPNSKIELEVKVKPGTYRVRIYSSNIANVADEDEGADRYKIEIWPGSKMKRKVLKQFVDE